VTGGPLSTASASDDWYEVTVQAPELQSGVVVNPTAYPYLYLSGDLLDYVFDVFFNAAGTLATNCSSGTTAMSVSSFYGTSYPGSGTALNCTLPSSPQLLLVRVRALGTNANCGKYTLNFSD
jgi:hypothetical protein